MNDEEKQENFYVVQQLILPSPRVYVIKTWSFLEILQRWITQSFSQEIRNQNSIVYKWWLILFL